MDATSLADGDWPLFALTLRTERLALRMPTDDDLVGLLAVIRGGIVGDEPYPFSTTWAHDPEPGRTWGALSFHWRCRAEVTPDSFNLPLAVLFDGEVIGCQSIGADDFGALRTFGTGSWLGRPWQGRRFAKEMRAAVLTLGFDHLGGEIATSSARETTDRSIKVSAGLGYRENGRMPFRFGDETGVDVRFRLDRADWEAQAERPLVTVEGWEACAPMFQPR